MNIRNGDQNPSFYLDFVGIFPHIAWLVVMACLYFSSSQDQNFVRLSPYAIQRCDGISADGGLDPDPFLEQMQIGGAQGLTRNGPRFRCIRYPDRSYSSPRAEVSFQNPLEDVLERRVRRVSMIMG